jgi:hypothetical protein
MRNCFVHQWDGNQALACFREGLRRCRCNINTLRDSESDASFSVSDNTERTEAHTLSSGCHTRYACDLDALFFVIGLFWDIRS